MAKVSHSYFRTHIEDHFASHDLEVAVRKRKYFYNIYWADDEYPLAQLRPVGDDDEVEVYHWNDGEWKPVREFGLAFPLEEALYYITDDPDDLFFDQEEEETDDEDAAALAAARRQHRRSAMRPVLYCTTIGAAVGGMCSHVLWGAALSTAVTSLILMSLVFSAIGLRLVKPVAAMALAFGLYSCAGALTGSAVHVGLGGGLWPTLCGAIVGSTVMWLIVRGAGWSWLLGLLAGLNLAVFVIDAGQLREGFLGMLLVALLAGIGAQICRFVDRWANEALAAAFDGDPESYELAESLMQPRGRMS